MIQKILVFILAAGPLLLHSATGFYFGAQGGVNFLNCQFLEKRHCFFNTGYTLGAVTGYAWRSGLSIEGEITYHDNLYRLHGTEESGDATTFHGVIRTWSFMFNGYYDVPYQLCRCIKPYLGGGIGSDYVHQKIKISGENYRGSHKGFAWQLMAGANCPLLKDLILSCEYKFHVSPLRYKHYLQNHSIILGLDKFFWYKGY